MGQVAFARHFRLQPGGVECDRGGLRIGGVAMLARRNGGWAQRDEGELNRELAKLYGFPLDVGRARRRLDAIAAALTVGEIARADCHCCLRSELTGIL